MLFVGNIDGSLKAFDLGEDVGGLQWRERRNYLKGIAVAGFSRAVLAAWQGRDLLIVGQGDGKVRAFFNTGTDDVPLWVEEKRFFRDVRAREHSAPTVFDLDGDGQWELIVGDVDGKLAAYRVEAVIDGVPVWREVRNVFSSVRVAGFSTPSLERYGGAIYLFVGQEDGRIRIYRSEEGKGEGGAAPPVFAELGEPADLALEGHSSPFIRERRGELELVSGDYDGNIRLFTCRTAAAGNRN
jgi:hypothetical protein